MTEMIDRLKSVAHRTMWLVVSALIISMVTQSYNDVLWGTVACSALINRTIMLVDMVKILHRRRSAPTVRES